MVLMRNLIELQVDDPLVECPADDPTAVGWSNYLADVLLLILWSMLMVQ